MKSAIKSELRKLLTVRTTYVIIIACLLITMLFAGYIEGVRASVPSLSNPDLLASESRSAVLFVGLILAFIGLMQLGHEYRYNTIMYTLTSSNKRLKPFFAKAIVIAMFSVVMGLVITFFSPLCTILGLKIGGHTLGPQQFDYFSIIWRCVYCVFGYSMYAFILVAIIRSQIGAIVTFLLMPLMGENILAALIKDNVRYLPFSSLQGVAVPNAVGGGVSPAQSAFTSGLYIIVGLAVGAYLFQRRDAN
jgi:ABC-2 type transport system permease protein